LTRLALVAPQLRKAHSSAEFPGFGLLLASNGKRAFEEGFCLRCIPLGREERDFPGRAIDLGFAPPSLVVATADIASSMRR